MTAIAPMLSVRSGAKAIEFYKSAFGAGELFRVDDESGAVVARLSVGTAEFWVADESPEHANFSPESLGGGSVRMVMTVEDPDAAFDRAVAAGATVVWPVASVQELAIQWGRPSFSVAGQRRVEKPKRCRHGSRHGRPGGPLHGAQAMAAPVFHENPRAAGPLKQTTKNDRLRHQTRGTVLPSYFLDTALGVCRR
jgi:PhnB protein